MTIDFPSDARLLETARQYGLPLGDHEAAALRRMLEPIYACYRLLDAQPDAPEAPRYPREAGYKPDAAEDPHNAWFRRTSVRGAATGPLRGRRIALKDNIFLAGVPMANGSALLDGFVPQSDATVVTRLLDAGAEITGKAACENLCLSGASFTSSTGPIHNPHRHGHSAGGSSSGCGVVVATGDADMAIGGDQGGSIRMPASMCGIYGMKPTYGLVPYTGAMPMEPTIDHLGPMTASVEDNARLLEVIAGDDGIDPRQRNVRTHRYTEALGHGLAGMRVAVLDEGFSQPGANTQVNERVRAAADALRRLGAQVEHVSVPIHADAARLCRPILIEGMLRTVFDGDGFGTGRHDLYPLDLMAHFRGWRARAGELADATRVMLVAGTQLSAQHGAHYYAKASNFGRRLRTVYDTVLAHHDAILMPTTPAPAQPLPPPDADREALVGAAFGISANTFPFNVTGHPAMSVPCGLADGLPVGMMLVARHFDEPAIYRIAHAYEQAVAWKTLS